MSEFPRPPQIPPEIWEELEKLEIARRALERFIAADLPKQDPAPHARTLKDIEDARREREK